MGIVWFLAVLYAGLWAFTIYEFINAPLMEECAFCRFPIPVSEPDTIKTPKEFKHAAICYLCANNLKSAIN